MKYVIKYSQLNELILSKSIWGNTCRLNHWTPLPKTNTWKGAKKEKKNTMKKNTPGYWIGIQKREENYNDKNTQFGQKGVQYNTFDLLDLASPPLPQLARLFPNKDYARPHQKMYFSFPCSYKNIAFPFFNLVFSKSFQKLRPHLTTFLFS